MENKIRALKCILTQVSYSIGLFPFKNFLLIFRAAEICKTLLLPSMLSENCTFPEFSFDGQIDAFLSERQSNSIGCPERKKFVYVEYIFAR